MEITQISNQLSISNQKVTLSELNAHAGKLNDAIRENDAKKAKKLAHDMLQMTAPIPTVSLESVIGAIMNLISAINLGLLPAWADMASHTAKINQEIAQAQSAKLKADTAELSQYQPSDPQYQQILNQFTDDNAMYNGWSTTVQNDSSNEADAVSEFTKTFQGDYQNISAFIQISRDVAGLLQGG